MNNKDCEYHPHILSIYFLTEPKNFISDNPDHFVKYWGHESLTSNKIIYRYEMTNNAYLRVRKEKEYKRLVDNGYEFRKTPVPFVHKYKNRFSNRPKGLMKELRDDMDCELEYKGLVRAKRKHTVRCLMGWDGYSNYNRQRGWKRAKKRKQWEK